MKSNVCIVSALCRDRYGHKHSQLSGSNVLGKPETLMSGGHAFFFRRSLAGKTGAPRADPHNRAGEDNVDAHVKRQIMGREVVVAITKGKLNLRPWEQIFHSEFDGRRRNARW